MLEAEMFDAIVIGAGQGGGPLATALIERKYAGGTTGYAPGMSG